jgi:hypothetical protein
MYSWLDYMYLGYSEWNFYFNVTTSIFPLNVCMLISNFFIYLSVVKVNCTLI